MMRKVFAVPNDPFFMIHRAKLKMRCRSAFGPKKWSNASSSLFNSTITIAGVEPFLFLLHRENN
jgi:hypothetical protein